MNNEHRPVLLSEAIQGLAIKPDGIYIDGTYGRGGHTKAILEKLSIKGKLFAIDKDPAAVAAAKKQWANEKRFYIQHDSFANLNKLVTQFDVQGGIHGILLDLGMSSPQLNESERGFSFLRDGPLDMRMNTEQGIDAATWLSQVTEKELSDVLKTYGEERYAKQIAKVIIKTRQKTPIKTTRQLVEIITNTITRKEKHKHPATRSFQAIRIFINRELEELKTGLEQSLEALTIGGRLVVISFHSLEDRIVKQFIKRHAKGDVFPARVPIKQSELNPRLKQIGKAIKPGEEEIINNPRARSAVMRIAEKIA